jgi:hypothetical protein
MNFKVVLLKVGKGKTIEENGTWTKKYYEVELAIEEENQIELAKESSEALLDTWLRGELVNKPAIEQQAKSYDAENITWMEVEGSSGPYQRSEDINSLDHKALLKDLAEHKGKFRKDGLFYWTFKNGATVGRKKV